MTVFDYGKLGLLKSLSGMPDGPEAVYFSPCSGWHFVANKVYLTLSVSQDVIMQFLTTDELKLNAIDADDPEVSDYNELPETARLADTVKSCLQESDDIPRDFTRLFDTKLFSLDTSMVAPAIKLVASCLLSFKFGRMFMN